MKKNNNSSTRCASATQAYNASTHLYSVSTLSPTLHPILLLLFTVTVLIVLRFQAPKLTDMSITQTTSELPIPQIM